MEETGGEEEPAATALPALEGMAVALAGHSGGPPPLPMAGGIAV